MKSRVTVPARVLVVVAVVTLCFAAGQDESNLRLPNQRDERGDKPWACCDVCRCSRSTDPSMSSPQCTCADILIGGCHPNCKNCLMLPIRVYPYRYQCQDVIYEDCGKRCTK